jgi:hypothetical protein
MNDEWHINTKCKILITKKVVESSQEENKTGTAEA